jgi:molecular chaperone HscA
MEHAQDDMEQRRLREQQVEAGRVLEALEAALAEDGDRLLDAGERKVIDAAAVALQQAGKGSDYRAIKQAIEGVEKASGDYVARRMNDNISKAMAGHRLDEFESS